MITLNIAVHFSWFYCFMGLLIYFYVADFDYVASHSVMYKIGLHMAGYWLANYNFIDM